jgi:Holliday junction resolvase RusA-like endonuclease
LSKSQREHGMKYTITIPRIPISQNSSEWRSRWTRIKYKALWHRECWVLLKEAQVKPMEQVRLSAVVYFPDKRKRDLDNYHAPIFKAACDALVYAGVIPDDDTRYIPELPGLRFGYDKGNPRTEIVIERVEG